MLLSHTGSGDPGQTRVRRAADEGSSIEDQVRDVRVPMLFMTGAFDDDSAPLGAALERAAREPVEIVSLDTGEHGTDILRFGDPAVADRLRQTVLGFLAGF